MNRYRRNRPSPCLRNLRRRRLHRRYRRLRFLKARLVHRAGRFTGRPTRDALPPPAIRSGWEQLPMVNRSMRPPGIASQEMMNCAAICRLPAGPAGDSSLAARRRIIVSRIASGSTNIRMGRRSIALCSPQPGRSRYGLRGLADGPWWAVGSGSGSITAPESVSFSSHHRLCHPPLRRSAAVACPDWSRRTDAGMFAGWRRSHAGRRCDSGSDRCSPIA